MPFGPTFIWKLSRLSVPRGTALICDSLGTLIMHVGDSYYRFFQGSWVGGGVSLVKVSRVKVGAWCGNALRWLHKICLENWTKPLRAAHVSFVKCHMIPISSQCFNYQQPPFCSIRPFRPIWATSARWWVRNCQPWWYWRTGAPGSVPAEDGPQHDCNIQDYAGKHGKTPRVYIYIYISLSLSLWVHLLYFFTIYFFNDV